MFSGRAIFGGVAVLGVAALLCAGVELDYRRSHEQAQQRYVSESHSELVAAAHNSERVLQAIYQNIRMLSVLPSVRKIGRHAEQLDSDGWESIRQVYSNLASSVSVSGVYLLPADFNPDHFDPVTGKPEEPILTLDELIAGTEQPLSEVQTIRPSKFPDGPPPEDKTHEYAQFAKQFGILKARWPDQSTVSGMDVPMLSGPEIITSDNTEYLYTADDKDRSGLTFVVPIYGLDGKLKGSVAAIILTNALRQVLPSRYFQLINSVNHFNSGGQLPVGAAALSGVPPTAQWTEGRIFNERIALSVGGTSGEWHMAASFPNARFANGLEAQTALVWRNFAFLAIGLTSMAALIVLLLVLRNFRLVRAMNMILQDRVAENTVEIANLANHDRLTGLLNRFSFSTYLHEHCLDLSEGKGFRLYRMAVENLDEINNSLDQALGDSVARHVAKRLSALGGPNDRVGRLGDNEFVLIEAGASGHGPATAFASMLVSALMEPCEIDGRRVELRISVGVATAPKDGDGPELLMRKSAIALKHAHTDQRLRYAFYREELAEELRLRQEFETDLAEARAKGELRLYYQPVVDAHRRQVVGFEALMRWEHPARGLVPPAEFIGVAEDIGIIAELGQWAIEQACRDAKEWPDHVRVAVNLSPLQFKNADFADRVIKALTDSELAPWRLELEITESVLLDEESGAVSALRLLRKYGVKIALDDFGTGYSSLSYLRSFPFDKIKIDRSFVTGIETINECAAIVKSVALLAASLGMEVTAEGVETESQFDIVKGLGCHLIQGYLFGQPVPLSQTSELIAERRVA